MSLTKGRKFRCKRSELSVCENEALSYDDVTGCCVHTGLLFVISIGVALGVAVGVFLLFALIVCHRR